MPAVIWTEPAQAARLLEGLDRLQRNTRDLQERVMQIRMLPISFAFNRFPRLVHDLSAKMGKKVELKLTGEQTELDKTVIISPRQGPSDDTHPHDKGLKKPAQEPAETDGLEKTVIISQPERPTRSPGDESTTGKRPPVVQPEKRQEDELEETKIIQPPKGPNRKSKQ